MTDHKVRISRPIVEYFEGTQLWADLDDGGEIGPDEHNPHDVIVFKKIRDATPDSRGAVKITVESGEEVESLITWADYLMNVCADGVAAKEMSALGELNAARALDRNARKLLAAYSPDPENRPQ